MKPEAKISCVVSKSQRALLCSGSWPFHPIWMSLPVTTWLGHSWLWQAWVTMSMGIPNPLLWSTIVCNYLAISARRRDQPDIQQHRTTIVFVVLPIVFVNTRSVRPASRHWGCLEAALKEVEVSFKESSDYSHSDYFHCSGTRSLVLFFIVYTDKADFAMVAHF